MYSSVLSGMADDGVLSDCDQHIWKADEIKAKKRRELHGEWNAKVFDTIQGRVQDAVTNRSCADIESRLRTQYEDYLKACPRAPPPPHETCCIIATPNQAMSAKNLCTICCIVCRSRTKRLVCSVTRSLRQITTL